MIKKNTSSTLLINEPPLQVLPSLAVAIGLAEALVLQQVHYWLLRSGKERDGKVWVYNTTEEWQQQFPFFSVTTVRRTIQNLRDKGLLLAGNYNSNKFDRTIWYSIDYEKLESIYSSWTNGNGLVGDTNTIRLTTEIATSSSQEEEVMSLPFSDFPEPVKETASPATKKKHAAPGPTPSRSSNEAKEIVKAYEKVLQEQTPGAIVAWPREVKAATAMVKAGWTEANVMLAYAHMKAQDYWQDKVLHLDKVAEQIATVWQTLKVKYPHLAPAMLKDEPYTIVWHLADGRIVEEQTTVSDAKRRGHYRS